MKFLKENWIWILLPALLALAVLAYAVFFVDGDPVDGFIYPL